MDEKKAVDQLKSLIDDRKSFCVKGEDNEIYLDDIGALSFGIEAISERKRLRQILVSTIVNEASFITECCPHCDNEVTVVWSPCNDGHSLFCPYCGERIMLCSECPVMDGETGCDWHRSANKSDEPVCFWDDILKR